MNNPIREAVEPIKKIFYQHKLTLQLLGVAFACIAMLYFGLILYITTHDPRGLNESLHKATQTYLAGEVTLGKAHWHFFPTLTLKVDSITAKADSNQTLLKAKNVTLYTEFWSLLSGNIRIKQLEIEQLETFIELNGDSQYQQNDVAVWADSLKNLNTTHFLIHKSNIQVSTPHSLISVNGARIEIENFRFSKSSALNISGQVSVEYNGESFTNGLVDINSVFKLTKEKLKFTTFKATSEWQDLLPLNLLPLNLSVNIESVGEFNFKTNSVLIDPLNVTMNNSHISIRVNIDKLFQTPEFVFSFPIQKPLLGPFAKYYLGSEPGMDHVTELIDSLEFGGHFIMTGQKRGLLLKTFKIDAHPGSINITYNTDSKLWESEIDLAYIDLRPILAPPESAKIKGRSVYTPAQMKTKDIELPIQKLRSLTLQSTIKVGNFIHPQFQLNNLNIHTDMDNGIVNFEPVKFNIFKGQASLKASLDTNQSPAQLDLVQSSEQLDIGDLLSSTTNNKWFTGLFDNTLDTTSKGNSIGDLIKNTTGTLDVKMKKGFIPGANLHQIAYNSIDTLKGILSASSRASFDRSPAMKTSGTVINNLFTSLKITKETISTSEMLAQINNEITIGTLAYDRVRKILHFTHDVQIPSTTPLLNKLNWPVMCVIEKWGLPMCGVPKKATMTNLSNLTRSNATQEHLFIPSNDPLIQTDSIGEALNKTWKQLR